MTTRTRIHALKTSGGYLEHAEVRFGPKLNCIIGARGTCKSTTIETIRFAFNCDSERVNLLTQHDSLPDKRDPSIRGMLRATLGEGFVRCDIVDESEESNSITIERSVGSDPLVWKDGIKEISEKAMLDQVEIYSQGDLQRIAEDDDLRLDLIDRPNKTTVSRLKAERDKEARLLGELGPQIKNIQAAIESRRRETTGLSELRQRLSDLQAQRPELSTALDNLHSGFLRRKALLEHVEPLLQRQRDTIAALASYANQDVVFAMIASRLKEEGIEDGLPLAESFLKLASVLRDIKSMIGGVDPAMFSQEYETLKSAVEDLNDPYYKIRKEQQDLNESLKREEQLKLAIRQRERLLAEIDDLAQEEVKLKEERSLRRSAINSINDAIYLLRAEEVEKINSHHGGVVVLTLEQRSLSSQYLARIADLLGGSRLRNQMDVAREIAEKINPADFVDIVEGGNSQRLAQLLGRDSAQMARLIAFVVDNPDLYKVESIAFDDRLEITMYDGGVPKPVGQLSKGQKATALLPLILRPAPYPLIFDQPEDDLDNRFIYTTLVEKLKMLKEYRQVILVTHNANIPVLGEAENVIVMHMDNPKKAARPVSGNVDEVKTYILSLLEGGAEAFRRRQEKYGELLG